MTMPSAFQIPAMVVSRSRVLLVKRVDAERSATKWSDTATEIRNYHLLSWTDIQMKEKLGRAEAGLRSTD